MVVRHPQAAPALHLPAEPQLARCTALLRVAYEHNILPSHAWPIASLRPHLTCPTGIRAGTVHGRRGLACA